MTEYPFSPSGAGILVTAQAVTNAQANIGEGQPGKRCVRIVNRAATPVFVLAGNSTVDATNTDYTVIGSASGLLLIGAGATHVSVKASTGSSSSVLIQPGYVLT